jgi:hypothetical protein
VRAEPPPFLTVAALRERYANHEDRYIELDGVRLRFRDEGEGQVIERSPELAQQFSLAADHR